MNTELMKLVYKQATEFPETVDMTNWVYETSCGTVACLAGHTLLLSGYTFESCPTQREGKWGCRIRRPDGSSVAFPAVEAAELLGLTCPQAESVFLDYEHGTDNLRKLIEENA